MKINHFSAIGLILLSLSVYAGDRGHGGGSHFCPNKEAQESYDIYEGRKRYRLNFNTTQSSIDEILDNAIKKVEQYNYSLAKRIETQVKFVTDPKIFVLDQEIQLTPIPDANILLVDKNCEYRQLANWDTATQQIFVDETIYEKLPVFHKAALILHEAVYKVARDTLKAQNSDLTRRFTAEILSLEPEVPTYKSFSFPGDVLGNPKRENLLSVNTDHNDNTVVNITLNDQLNADLKDYQVITEFEFPKLVNMHQSYKSLKNEIKDIEIKILNASRRETTELYKRLEVLKVSVNKLDWFYKDLKQEIKLNDNGKIEIKESLETITRIDRLVAHGEILARLNELNRSFYGLIGNLDGKIRVRVTQGDTVILESTDTYRAIRKITSKKLDVNLRRDFIEHKLMVNFKRKFSRH